MKTLFLLCTIVCGQALAQQAGPTPPGTEASASRPACAAARQDQPNGACATPADIRTAMADPDKLLATDPTAARPRPLTREQVVAEIARARRAGEMDFATIEASLAAPRRR